MLVGISIILFINIFTRKHIISQTCKVNPFARERKRALSRISVKDIYGVRDDAKKGEFDLEHLDNACKACPENIEKISIRTGTRRTIAAVGGAGFVGGLPVFIIGAFPGAIIMALDSASEARKIKNKIPECYSNFQNLKKLKASSLSLSNIDPVLKIESLEKLDLYGNNLTMFPDISRLSNLKELNLRQNLLDPFKCVDIKVKRANSKYKDERLSALRECLINGGKIEPLPRSRN